MNSLFNYKQTIKLKWDILKIGFNFINQSTVREIEWAFELMDSENKGFVTD